MIDQRVLPVVITQDLNLALIKAMLIISHIQKNQAIQA